jgi:hypothetical protein
MTKPLLIWQPNVFPDEEKEIAAKYFCVVDYNPSLTPIPMTPFVMRGAVTTATRLGHNLQRFDTRCWVPYLYKHMISQTFWWDVPERITGLGINWPLFIRPDSCKKLFAGQVYSKDKWREEFLYLKQRNGEKILAFVATPEEIGYEWRCLFVGQELIDVSAYMFNGEILDPPLSCSDVDSDIAYLANRIRGNDYFSPEDNLTIDIGQRSDGSYRLVEINFLETSGWYNVDKGLVYAKLAKQLL